MLQQLHIQNIALIDDIHIEPGEGLNVLTGETGAGKSIIIDSINALLGNRVTRELIRTGCEKACIEAIFHLDPAYLSDMLEELGAVPEEDGTLIISREFNIAGRNTCRVNGRLVTVSALKDIGERLIDLHGQHDNQSLLKVERHIDLLDSFGGSIVQTLKKEYTKNLEEFRSIRSQLKELSGDPGERERKIDLLKYQMEEIRKAKLKENEEEELEKQRLLLLNAEKISGALSSAYEMLYSGNGTKKSAYDSLNMALSELTAIASMDTEYASAAGKLEELLYQLEDITEDIRKKRDGVEHNPEQLEQVEERLDRIFRLKRKYGSSIRDILEYYKKLEHELEDMEGNEKTVENLSKRLSVLSESLYGIACKLNEERRKAAALLEEKITGELEDLEMKRAQFKVNIVFDATGEDSERKFTSNGLDRVEFLISANAGEPLKPLSKIASGGEMSRIMLAIKKILADVDSMPTLIFDEIDIGISGKAAQKVGEKLSYISRKHQVICVTHLAQIACMADSHFLIEKHVENDATKTRLMMLTDSEIVEEVARILDGNSISDITKSHAKEMLKNARKLKKNM